MVQITFNHDPEFDKAIKLIKASGLEDYLESKDYIIGLLEFHKMAPILMGAIEKMSSLEWEDFTVNYLGDD